MKKMAEGNPSMSYLMGLMNMCIPGGFEGLVDIQNNINELRECDEDKIIDTLKKQRKKFRKKYNVTDTTEEDFAKIKMAAEFVKKETERFHK